MFRSGYMAVRFAYNASHENQVGRSIPPPSRGGIFVAIATSHM